MPTGYTHKVQDGTTTEFKDFALQCARAFGACIEMRDDPADTPIPDSFEPSDYHVKALTEAQAHLDQLLAMSPAQIEEAAKADFAANHSSWLERQLRKSLEKERYESMLAKVRAYEPPSFYHREYKKFMIDQLTESIRFDCVNSYDKEPQPQEPAEWHAKEIKKGARSVGYNAEENAKEIARAAGLTQWVGLLKRSLGD